MAVGHRCCACNSIVRAASCRSNSFLGDAVLMVSVDAGEGDCLAFGDEGLSELGLGEASGVDFDSV